MCVSMYVFVGKGRWDVDDETRKRSFGSIGVAGKEQDEGEEEKEGGKVEMDTTAFRVCVCVCCSSS